MMVKFLGTGAAEGWPGLFCQCTACMKARAQGGKNIRTRSSVIIDNKYLVDFPPDNYYHMIQNNLDLGEVTHLIITHSHGDHFYLPDLRLRRSPFAHINDMKALNIYANDKVKSHFDNFNKEYITGGMLRFHLLKPFEPVKADDAIIWPLLANHDKKECCYIYIIEINKRKLLYAHDTGYFPEETWSQLKDHYFDGVILDCTAGPKKEGTNHMGFPDNLEIRQRLIDGNNADDKTKFIITHFSHNGEALHDELLDLAEPYGIDVAYDGAKFNI